MVPALSHRVSRVPWYSGSCHALKDFGYGAFTLSCRSFQFRSPVLSGHSCSPNPAVLRTAVWAPPVPLAATPGITFVFFSSGYLDVSVHRVPSVYLLGTLVPYSVYGDGGFLRRVSPFRHLRIFAHVQLPAAFRSLSRLSSALSAKASALCSFLLNLLLPLHSVAASALFLVFCSGIPPLPESLSALFDVFSLFLDLQYSVFKVPPAVLPDGMILLLGSSAHYLSGVCS